jgi:hypothetical protein
MTVALDIGFEDLVADRSIGLSKNTLPLTTGG